MATNPSNATSQPTIQLIGLARQLVQNHLLDEAAALKAFEQSRKDNTPFVAYLVDNKLARDKDIARVAARSFNLPLFDLDTLEIDLTTVRLVDEKLLRRHFALPLYKRGRRLFVGLSDPTNQRVLEDIKFQTRLDIEPIIVSQAQIAKALDSAIDAPVSSMTDGEIGDLDFSTDSDPTGKVETLTQSDADDAPVVRFINQVILQAINRGASDIHFEPYEKTYRVRFRQDGILDEVYKPPVSMAPRLAARLKIMGQMDIAERRVPQDGRIKLYLTKQRAIDFRVNTLPTLWGEKVVMRLLDPSSAQMGIEALGYEDHQKELFLKAIHKPQGMVLVTGPTGSGKTVSLYTGLNILNTPSVNISTAEDPVEINLAGINQVNVNTKVGMTFANALRSFLRQDPDIIMVGEIRDLETAEIAIKAAQTGHMVLSTLHTNSAPQTLSRLMNMGVAPYNIASSVTLIIAQRLARRLCQHCKELVKIPPDELINQGFREHELKDLEVFKAAGCDQCNHGYKGRVGVYEVMPISEDIGRIIMEGGNALHIADKAREEGINDLRRSGLNKIRMGLTSLEEINRVTTD
ncbi:putative integral membrane protein involved in biogenesis of fimbriae (type IV pilin), protein transport, DNA uptake with P-loop containing NTP hydrolysis domain [Candidatus Competibacter denitrificans Run_A_D11]|uniref:Integral membrane protein involved in biogenesis of fimbriae (Type IV pilin), protein transport, DNA uptake with P-loop containing NTP hydrolysis domain n=1 Tax=Candidatus Competibacter denitrificans Run_A_D11 TaxID=1400863 RepID=W6M1S6_9GAMM|nr:type IV-A pilus assembly ATPase PilB [Candidatus Competibacter denitrificans]CDI01387.1 putative integral membrane protein involved in biogenesis of fimbriae (type IV pilin), protein transport, DNA uptake with P-loop containing NTP hydrolysis domain [Candidatus Competibacter denitrificans Run_A_D11]HRC69224.1 type IV-A pilus assembly ATPase PilB [Candidatus Competibacter denitrificans]